MKFLRLILLLLGLARAAATDALLTLNETSAFYNLTASGTLAVSGAATFSTNVSVTGGPLIRASANVTSSTTLSRAYHNVLVSDSAGDVVLTLPDATTHTGVEFRITKRTGNNKTTVTASELIGGIAYTIPVPTLTSVTLQSNGAQWQMVESPLEPIIKSITTAGTTNLAVGDFNIVVNDDAGSITLNLPRATNFALLGRKIYIQKRDGTNTTTLSATGSDTIDGATSLTIPYKGALILQSDLSAWRIMGTTFLPLLTSDPSVVADGSLWYRTDTDVFKGRANGATVALATQPTTETLTASGGTLTITAGKGPNQSSRWVANGNVTLAFASLADNDGGRLRVWPATTNVTITLPNYASGPSGSTLTVNGGTGSTNYTEIVWVNGVESSTNRVSINALNYYR